MLATMKRVRIAMHRRYVKATEATQDDIGATFIAWMSACLAWMAIMSPVAGILLMCCILAMWSCVIPTAGQAALSQKRSYR